MLDPNKIGIKYKDFLPHRDAKLIFVFCEGKNREKDYFEFFEAKSSRLKIEVFPPNESQSAPIRILSQAIEVLRERKKEKIDEVWFVVDTDRWVLHDFLTECGRKRFNVVVSNPSFEVWLYFHFFNIEAAPPPENWKEYINKKVSGGFDSNIHQHLIINANDNSEKKFKGTDYTHPELGSTSVFLLGKSIVGLMKKEILELLEHNKNHPKLKKWT